MILVEGQESKQTYRLWLELGVYPCTVITAITAQNTSRVNHITPVDSHSIRKQIESVFSDIPLRAIKIGMVYNREIISIISSHLKKYETPIVLDPVLQQGLVQSYS